MTLGRDTHQEGLFGTSSLSTSERLYNNVVPSFLLILQLSFIFLRLPGIRREGLASNLAKDPRRTLVTVIFGVILIAPVTILFLRLVFRLLLDNFSQPLPDRGASLRRLRHAR